MKPQTALVWIILAVLMLAYLIYYNIKMTKILRKVLKLTDESKDRCVSLLDRMRSCTDRKEQKDILREYEAEEQKMTEIFSKKEDWPGQGKKIREHLKIVKEYRRKAKKLAEGNKDHV
ncbi:hypothetical protein AALA78_08565 [Lachnospiraceae bacterium 42-17]